MSRRRKPPSKLAVIVSFSVFGIAVAISIFTFFIAPPLEQNVTTTWKCDVTSAEPRQSSGGFKGASTVPSVLLHTTDCGDILLYSGVTFDNAASVAWSVRPGEYELRVGWVSAHILTLIPNTLPTAQAYRLVE